MGGCFWRKMASETLRASIPGVTTRFEVKTSWMDLTKGKGVIARLRDLNWAHHLLQCPKSRRSRQYKPPINQPLNTKNKSTPYCPKLAATFWLTAFWRAE